MKRIIFYVLIVLGIAATVKWKQGVINTKRSMPTISINNEYEKFGKPVQILNISKETMKFSERLTGSLENGKATLLVGANQWRRIKMGQEAQLVNKEGQSSGSVIVKGTSPDTETGLFEIVVNFNSDLSLKNAVVDIYTREKDGVISIPTTAISETEKGEFVWVLNGADKAGQRKVQTGDKSLYNSEIVSGLSVGDKVIIRGASSLTTKDKVRVALTGEKK